VLIVDNQDMKRHVVGKKCITGWHHAADRLLATFGDASELLHLWLYQKTLWSVGDTKFYRYPCEPECQRHWKLTGMRHDWAPTEHATIILSKKCPQITAVKVAVSVQLFPGLQLA